MIVNIKISEEGKIRFLLGMFRFIIGVLFYVGKVEVLLCVFF